MLLSDVETFPLSVPVHQINMSQSITIPDNQNPNQNQSELISKGVGGKIELQNSIQVPLPTNFFISLMEVLPGRVELDGRLP